uniref:EGF-like domain-containing protein n=1 Tax=Strombidinopsis acuminata TaxID=141414 RepID=A0A7S3X7S5_9SPIT
MPSQMDLSHCSSSCHGHGICVGWKLEPRFPAFCVCKVGWQGDDCRLRMPNPFHWREEAAQYEKWKSKYGVACGPTHSAVSCSECGAAADMCGGGGDCVWQDGACIESQTPIGRSESEGREMNRLAHIQRGILKKMKDEQRARGLHGGAGDKYHV